MVVNLSYRGGDYFFCILKISKTLTFGFLILTIPQKIWWTFSRILQHIDHTRQESTRHACMPILKAHQFRRKSYSGCFWEVFNGFQPQKAYCFNSLSYVLWVFFRNNCFQLKAAHCSSELKRFHVSPFYSLFQVFHVREPQKRTNAHDLYTPSLNNGLQGKERTFLTDACREDSAVATKIKTRQVILLRK